MNKNRLTSIVSLLTVVIACSNEHAIVATKAPETTGTIQLSVDIGKIGALKKTMTTTAVEMSSLFIVLSSDTQSALRDTIALSGGSQERTFVKSYGGLVAWIDGKTVEWTLRIETKDQNGRVVHSGDTTFTLLVNDTVDISLSLDAQYSMLVANYFPIRDSVTQCMLLVDGYTAADSSFPKQSQIGNTITLSTDYLTANKSGIVHSIILDVYGELQGVDTLLYTGDTTITVRSGNDANYQVTLDYVGPNELHGAETMTVSLGKIGSVTIDGILLKHDTIYVDSGATGANTGTTWHDAFTTLQEALSNAHQGSTLLIAEGTYYPDSTDRKISFVLKNSVKLYGGYPQGGGMQDVELHTTTLSGEMQKDGESSNNSTKIVIAENVDTSCILNGVTVTGGYGNDTAGGMFIRQGSPRIEQCTFSGNYNVSTISNRWCVGGALCSSGGSPIISNCTFSSNRCSSMGNDGCCLGGAVYCTGGIPELTGCMFSNNYCNGIYIVRGGAISMSGGMLANCTFVGNVCNGLLNANGGAMELTNGTVINCTFANNSANGEDSYGGALLFKGGTLTNCTFTKNKSIGDKTHGGAICLIDSSSIFNCIFWEDTADTLPEISGTVPSIKNSFVQGGYADAGSIDSIFIANPLLGTLGNYGGPVRTIPIDPASPARNAGTLGVPSGVNISKDARGFLRDSLPDIGAFEVR